MKKFQPEFDFQWMEESVEKSQKKRSQIEFEEKIDSPLPPGTLHSVAILVRVGGSSHSTTKVEVVEAAKGFKTIIKREYACGQEPWEETHLWRNKTEAMIDAGHWESLSRKVDW